MSTLKKGVVSAKDAKENGLSKLGFTTSVFKEISLKQQEELRLAISGISEEYELNSEFVYFAVAIDNWFSWTTEEWEKYVKDVNKLSMEELVSLM